jgi:hypothetical protein
MRVFPSLPWGPVILVYATLSVCAAPGQVPPTPPPTQPPAVLPETPVSTPQILPGGPDVPAPAKDQTAGQGQDGKSSVDSRGQRPLTPEEIRQREIEKYDPLSRTSPLSPVRPGDTDVSSPDASDAQASKSGKSRGGLSKDPRNTPLPGSIAESNEGGPVNPNDPGPQVVSENGNSTGGPQYNGPAVLSRDYTISRPTVSREVKWGWTVGSAATWTSGLVSNSANPATAATNESSFGTATTFSVSGRHFWREDQLGLDYNVNYNRYAGFNAFNGTNQHLSLDYTHKFSRRLSLNVVENGSITAANYALQNPLVAPGVNVANINMAASPFAQLLDQTTRQFYTSTGVTWQQSARLSFNFSGGFFATQLTSTQLTGNTGYQAQADMSYRTTKKTTVGTYYSYSSYVYDRHVAVSDSNTVGLIYSYAFNLTTQLRLRAGISRLETLAYTQVPIDPAFAALVGQSYGIVDIYNRHATSDISAQFVKDLRHNKTANVSFTRGIAPGNGLILVSLQETATAGFATTFFRNYHFNVNAGRNSITSQAQNIASYTYNFVGVSFSRPLPHGVISNFSATYNKYSITNEPGLRSQFIISSGVSWGPGAGRLW